MSERGIAKRAAIKPSESSSRESAEFRAWVGAEWQILKECLPLMGPLPSDESAQVVLDRLVLTAAEVGPEKFHHTILKAIDTCERRPTVGTIRRLAGVNQRLDSHAETVALAWEMVTLIVRRHIGRDGEGNAIIVAHVSKGEDAYVSTPAPTLPEGVVRAVQSMGGWGALADSYPAHWGLRLHNFKELLRLTYSDAQMLMTECETALRPK